MPIYNTECISCKKVQEVLTLSLSEQLPKCDAIFYKIVDIEVHELLPLSKYVPKEYRCNGELRKLPALFGKQSANWSRWGI